MAKKCKQCWELTHPPHLQKYCSPDCMTQAWVNMWWNNRKQLQKFSKTNKNEVAKFTQETKAIILIRDKRCILCPSVIKTYHHVYYGGQAEYWKDRNNPEKWVWLCISCHESIHHFSKWNSQELRYKCIDYVKNLQNNKKSL